MPTFRGFGINDHIFLCHKADPEETRAPLNWTKVVANLMKHLILPRPQLSQKIRYIAAQVQWGHSCVPLDQSTGAYKTLQKIIFTSSSLAFILAGHSSSYTSLAKAPPLLLDQNWLPASWGKAQVEKFKLISFPSISNTLQQVLSPKEQGKSSLQLFPPTIPAWKETQLSERKETEGKNLFSSSHSTYKHCKEPAGIITNKWLTWLHASRLHLRFQEQLDIKPRLMKRTIHFPSATKSPCN